MRKILILTMLVALILSATTIGYCQANIKAVETSAVPHNVIIIAGMFVGLTLLPAGAIFVIPVLVLIGYLLW
jgi:hypothetical protein